MSELDLYVRGHIRPSPKDLKQRKNGSAGPGLLRWPGSVLLVHVDHKQDERQELLAGCFAVLDLRNDGYAVTESGVFHRDSAPRVEQRIFERFIQGSGYKLHPQRGFIDEIFLKALAGGMMLCAFDLPSAISRLAAHFCPAKRNPRIWSFYFRNHGKRPDRYVHGIQIWSLDALKNIYNVILADGEGSKEKYRKNRYAVNTRFLDLRTLSGALSGDFHDLHSACEAFGLPGVPYHKPTSRITKIGLERMVRDLARDVELLNTQKAAFDRHPVDLHPDRAYSPVSIAKAYYRGTKMKLPAVPDRINGIAEASLFAGEAECSLRRTAVPVTYVDCYGQFAGVSKLLHCNEIICAERLEFKPCTEEARRFLSSPTLKEDCFRPEFWPQMRMFVLVEPDDHIIPCRARWVTSGEGDPTIAWNFVSSKNAIWLTGPDAVDAVLRSKKPLKILRAFRVVPIGVQKGLKPVKLCGQLEVNPLTDDLACKMVELRSQVRKSDPALATMLKVAANGACFGALCQTNTEQLKKPSHLEVWSGEKHYITPEKFDSWEKPAEFYFPTVASLVCGGSHLLCGMLERSVGEAGGQIAMMDTDSACIVSREFGGLVPCPSGPDYTEGENPQSALKACSFTEVDAIRQQFETLNPHRATGHPFLKLEKENFDSTGLLRRQLYFYGGRAKGYCLYHLRNGKPVVVKPSGHGIGFLAAPFDTRLWERENKTKWTQPLPPFVYEAWQWLISQELESPSKRPSWFDLLAVADLPINSPITWKQIGSPEWLKPFTRVLVPMLENKQMALHIAPWMSNLKDLYGVRVTSLGGSYAYLSRKHDGCGLIVPRTMGQEVQELLKRPEAKFCTPSGAPCTPDTRGLLARRHVTAGRIYSIGREASSRWESGIDLSMFLQGKFDDQTCRVYPEPTSAKDINRLRMRAMHCSIRKLAALARVDEWTIKQFRKGCKVSGESLRKISLGVALLEQENTPKPLA